MEFEDALQRLEEIVSLLERGDVSLDNSLKFYEEGQGLIKLCRDKLTKVEVRVQELIRTEKGNLELKPAEIQEEPEPDNS
jgi:exodeoxyribonuclease VII small subunit